MDLGVLAVEGISAFGASLFFSLSLRGPRRTLIAASALGMAGQVIYSALKAPLGDNTAVLIATFAICIAAELFSRPLKAPVTVISFHAVIPLVPGVMLYRTMLCFSQGRYEDGTDEILRTVIYAGCMAIAISVAAMISKNFFPLIFRDGKKRTTYR